ncbi:MAG: hypothetical protein U1E97_12970 [Alphaproteobacteria bacterium]
MMNIRGILGGAAAIALFAAMSAAPAKADWIQTAGPVGIDRDHDRRFLDAAGSVTAPNGGAAFVYTNETDNGAVGLFLRSPGTGVRLGDALSPGCYCEAWGVAGNRTSGLPAWLASRT